MPANVDIVGATSGTGADVDSDKQLLVRTNTDATKAGAAIMFTESDPGTKTGVRRLLSPETSGDYRLRVALDTLLDSEIFDYANQNLNKHFVRLTTMTAILSGGALTTNGLAVNTTSIAVAVNTNKTFQFVNAGPLYVETLAALTLALGANTFIDFGLYVPGAANPYAPVDGVFYRFTSAGLFGVVNNNTAELTTSAFSFTPNVNQVYHYVIAIDQDHVEFWIDNVLYGTISTPAAQGGPSLSGSAPWAVRQAHVGGAAGSIVQFKVFAYGVSLGDYHTSKPWSHTLAGMYQSAHFAPSGSTNQGAAGVASQGPLWPANGAAAATTVPSATAATAIGLGGKTRWALTASAATDFILFSYQNPAASAVLPGKTLYIQRIKITAAVLTALVAPTAGIPLVAYALGVGATAITLATTDSASMAATTKRARFVGLGYQQFSGNVQTVTAPVIGSVGNEIELAFDTPIPLAPGEFMVITEQCLNAGAGGLIETNVALEGFWE